MKYTNINILDGTRRFKYIIEYQNDVEYYPSDDISYAVGAVGDDLRIDFFEEGRKKLIRNDNYWELFNNETVQDYLPNKYNISSINIYFPQNSVESYVNNNLYALTINTWIHGHIVYLGTHLIDRRNTLACKKERVFLNSRYFEYINLKIIDPWFITYSDDWKEFRQQICGEKEEENHELNNTGSVLNFTLYPVTFNSDNYIKLDPYIGGQNSINISDTISDYIGCDIELTEDATSKIVLSKIRFNQEYNTDGIQTFEDFKQYMQETYEVEGDIYLKYCLMIIDNTAENIYKSVIKSTNELYCIFGRDELSFDSWNGWKEGLKFKLILSICSKNDGSTDSDDTDDEEIMIIRSNAISITQDVMKYFIGENPINYVNLTTLDMKNYTINAVNKIEKKVIQLEKPTDYKSNLIKPVYYRSRDISNLIIHPEVTENICINLDAYKSTVSVFYIQIEGMTFVERARVNAGVIFKIVGSDLAGAVGEGTFYVLNQDKEMITSGKYKYEY